VAATADPELVRLFVQHAASVVFSPGDDDTPVSELRHAVTEAGLAAVLPVIVERVREQIAVEIETAGPGELRSRSWWADWVRGHGDRVTVVPSEYFDRLANDDEAPVPNEATRDAFRRLGETIERR
jgi:hypothetical protein